MSIAELHGKLSPGDPQGAHDGMEDLLTSDVFGTMLYAGWQPAFARWLAQAQFVPGCDPSTCIADFLPSDNGADIAYSVWPRLPNNREPDVDRKSTRLNSSHRCISYA